MKSLFLVTDSCDQVSSVIPAIKKLQGEESITVIALDFWAGKKLRDRGIPYNTPDQYLDMAICQRIDTEAVKMACNWYKPLADDLLYKGVPLGEMAELDFGYLFVETLRSIELAQEILSRESPDRIFLPPKFRLQELLGWDTMCYRTLPAAMQYFAELKGTAIVTSDRRLTADLAAMFGDLKAGADFLSSWFISVVKNLFRDFRAPFKHGDRMVSLFYGVPFYRSICQELDAKDNSCINIFRFPFPAVSKIARDKIKVLSKLWKGLSQSETRYQPLTFDGVPLLNLVPDRFQYFFTVQAAALIGSIEWAESMIRLFKPGILVIMDDTNPVYRTACRTFKLHKVPVLLLLHGAPPTDYPGMVGFQIGPIEAQKQAVWGEIYRDEWGVKRGKPAETQVVTGTPKYDFLVEGHHCDKNEICHKLGLDPDRGIVVIATEWYAGGTASATIEAGERYIRRSIQALKSFSDKQIVIKLHPTYHKKYRKIAAAIAMEENTRVIITEKYLWQLLSVSDLVIVYDSTVGLDAVVLNRPLVIVNTGGEPEGMPYVSGGVALGGREPEDIKAAIDDILNKEQVRQSLARAREGFIYEFAHLLDGKASQRIAELMEQMATKC